MKQLPDDVQLSREDGEAVVKRIRTITLTDGDQRFLVQLIRLYFWLTFSPREKLISQKCLKTVLFGGGISRQPPSTARGGSLSWAGGRSRPTASRATTPLTMEVWT